MLLDQTNVHLQRSPKVVTLKELIFIYSLRSSSFGTFESDGFIVT